MKDPAIVAEKQRLDYLFAQADQLVEADYSEIRSHWARYLCILVSGFFETTLQTLYCQYVRKRSQTNIANFVSKTLESNRSRNMKAGSLLQLVESFNKKWKQELEAYIDDNGRREALDSIINLRNNISHGGRVGVSLANIKDYYKRILEIIDFLESQCEKS